MMSTTTKMLRAHGRTVALEAFQIEYPSFLARLAIDSVLEMRFFVDIQRNLFRVNSVIKLKLLF